MLEILQIIGSFLERLERETPRIFWVVTTVLGLTFSSFDDRSLIRFQTPIEKNVSSVLAINSGDDGGFIPNTPIADKGDRGKNPLHDYDPKPCFGSSSDVSSSALPVDIDFPYKYDVNGNPTLLVPRFGQALEKPSLSIKMQLVNR